MRIISGEKKGRRVPLPVNLDVRPTTDFAKEALFSIINNNFDFDGLKVLDLFAGTGFISYEFASRGANSVITVDNNSHCYQYIKSVIAKLELDLQVNPVCTDAFRFLNSCRSKFNIIFADPPYFMENTNKIPELVFDKSLLEENGWLIIEHSANYKFLEHPHFIDTRKYGSVNFIFFQ